MRRQIVRFVIGVNIFLRPAHQRVYLDMRRRGFESRQVQPPAAVKLFAPRDPGVEFVKRGAERLHAAGFASFHDAWFFPNGSARALPPAPAPADFRPMPLRPMKQGDPVALFFSQPHRGGSGAPGGFPRHRRSEGCTKCQKNTAPAP